MGDENTMTKIRLMKITDYEQLWSLWNSCAGMGLNSLDDSADGIARFLARNPTTCFVAEESGEIVGAIMAGNDGRRGYIYHTAVLPEFSGQGIGRKLVDTAVESLKKCGIAKVALVVFARNEAGNAFWEKLGFSVREDLTYRNKSLAEMTRIDT